MKYCSKCGQPISDSAAFCPNCGNPTAQQQPQQPHPQPQQPPHAPQMQPYAPQGGYQQQQQYQGQQQYQQQYQKPNYTVDPMGRKVRNIDMLEACKIFWQKYADFNGRARRAEYWWAYLMYFIFCCIPYIGWLAVLASIIPMIAVGVRRLHDLGKSGWNMLLGLIPIAGPIILIVWYCQEGQYGANEYGEDPKYIQ